VASVIISLLHSLRFLVRSRTSLHLEIVVLRHQLAVGNRSRRQRLRLSSAERMLWAWLWQRGHGWRAALHVVQPATVGIDVAFACFGHGRVDIGRVANCPRTRTNGYAADR